LPRKFLSPTARATLGLDRFGIRRQCSLRQYLPLQRLRSR
jgi:hypothetical protein